MGKKFVIWAIVIALVAGGAGFFSGMAAGKANALKTANGGLGAGSFGGNFARTGGAGAGGRYFLKGGAMHLGSSGSFAAGQILSASANNIVIKMPNGSTKIILLSSATKINKSVAGSASDLSQGESVVISGTANQDGSISADAVDIRPSAPGAQ